MGYKDTDLNLVRRAAAFAPLRVHGAHTKYQCRRYVGNQIGYNLLREMDSAQKVQTCHEWIDPYDRPSLESMRRSVMATNKSQDF